ncbi:glycosyltransferase family 2 protein [Microbacterium amylolyticum]|uniref:GT2 family glycosyltransferase n=1 Tax=Microbacterium amylolyticum TaxID=936337 RepID=A0ABS4ZIF1_9MICO|nr:glycosyltransferase family 2 protein [Microbacterium amylolyticum]MBP2437066.1 GT2 family glycosyltransferase [Microbacterium amylolyticum]
MKVQAVVVNYQSSDYVRACLNSLALAGIDRVSVVDNYSTAHERLAIEEVIRQSPIEAAFTPLEENIGFGAGVNRGFAALGSTPEDLVWIVNPDAEVNSDALSSLAGRIVDGDADIVSPLILTGSRAQPVVWFGGGSIIESEGRTKHVHFGERLDGLTGLTPADFLTGAAPMMRSRVFDQMGGFREDLFLYWEDADFSRRAAAAGLRLAVDLDAHIWHAVGGSGDRSGKSAVYYYHMQRNRMLVAAPWTSRWNLLLGRGLKETLKLSLRPLKEPQARLVKLKSGFRGLRDGFRRSR